MIRELREFPRTRRFQGGYVNLRLGNNPTPDTGAV